MLTASVRVDAGVETHVRTAVGADHGACGVLEVAGRHAAVVVRYLFNVEVDGQLVEAVDRVQLYSAAPVRSLGSEPMVKCSARSLVRPFLSRHGHAAVPHAVMCPS